MLLCIEVFQCIHELDPLVVAEHVHIFGNRLNLFCPAKLDIPEAHTLRVLLTYVLQSLAILLLVARAGRTMLRHLGDATTSAWISLHTADVLPERVRVQRWLKWAIAFDNAHRFDCILFFQEHLERLACDTLLQRCNISFVPFGEDSLWDKEVWERVGKDVDLELDWISHIRATRVL